MNDERRTDLLQRALAAYRSSDDELAEDLAQQLLSQGRNESEAYMILGSLYGRQGRRDQAIAQFHLALEKTPDSPEAWNNIGVMYRTLGRMPQALEALEKAKNLDPGNAGVLYNLGNVLKQMGRFDEAVKAYEASLETNPRNAFTYNNLGTIYENSGDLDQAQDAYQRGLEIEPNNPNLRYNLGLVYQRQNEFRLARQSFEAALRARPGWKAGLNNLGVTLQKMGQSDEAMNLFQEMVREDPENPEALNNIGVLYQEMGKTAEAEAHFSRALKVNPRYGKAVLNLDSLYGKEGNVDRSIELLSRYSVLEPDNLSVRLQLAKLRLFQDSPEKAEEDLLAVLNKQPENIDALRTLGNLYLKTKRPYLAQKMADRIHKADPKSVDLHMDMALYALNEGETGTATKEVQIFLEANPDDQKARLLLANLYKKQNRKDDAQGILEQLRSEDPQNTAVLSALARLHQEGGDQEAALGLADAILRVQGKKSAGDELRLISETLEMYEKSADTLGTELRDIWQRNLRTLVEPLEDSGPETVEEEPLVEEPTWMQLLAEPRPPSLLEFGDLNPAIWVSEEEETIKMEEEEELLGPDEHWQDEVLGEDEVPKKDEEPDKTLLAASTAASAMGPASGERSISISAPSYPPSPMFAPQVYTSLPGSSFPGAPAAAGLPASPPHEGSSTAGAETGASPGENSRPPTGVSGGVPQPNPTHSGFQDTQGRGRPSARTSSPVPGPPDAAEPSGPSNRQSPRGRQPARSERPGDVSPEPDREGPGSEPVISAPTAPEPIPEAGTTAEARPSSSAPPAGPAEAELPSEQTDLPATETVDEPWDEPGTEEEPEPIDQESDSKPSNELPEEAEEIPEPDWHPPGAGEDGADAEESALPEGNDTTPQGSLIENEPEKVAALIDYLDSLAQFLPDDKRQELEQAEMPSKMDRLRESLRGNSPAAEETGPVPRNATGTIIRDRLKAILDRVRAKLAD